MSRKTAPLRIRLKNGDILSPEAPESWDPEKGGPTITIEEGKRQIKDALTDMIRSRFAGSDGFPAEGGEVADP